MASPSATLKTTHRGLLLPIVVGGLSAGTFDIISAFITFGSRVPRSIASGVLGERALQGGMATWTLGLILHYFIAFSAAAVYCLTSKKLRFMKEHFLVCGAFFGIAVYLVMNLVVLPLSAVPFKIGPFTLHQLIRGIVIHMLLIGVPIGYSLRKLSQTDI